MDNSKMMRDCFIGSLIVAVSAIALFGQPRPSVIGRRLPDPGPNRIEVRFALGEKAVTCKYFHLTATIEGRVIMEGKFASGFQIPADAAALHGKDADTLELDFKCGKNRWKFTKVGAAFSPGWWWVGTDYPPWQETFESFSFAQEAAWIRYLIVDPTVEFGFTVYKYCPTRLKSQNPGPCFDP